MMTDQAATSQQSGCSTCNGTGTVQKPIYNTATGTWTTVTETCLACL